MEGDNQPQRVVLAARGDSVGGDVYGQKFSIAVAGSRVTFSVGDFRWRANASGDSLRGWLGIGRDSSRWVGTRIRPPAVARSFSFTPRAYQRAVTARITPVLRLYAGDTVRTSTVDAGGWGRGAFGDRTNKLTIGGNPLVGPFYVEGAVPGDVIAVRLHRVRLNRDWAFSGTALIETSITADYAAGRKFDNQDNQWMLDTLSMTGRLKNAPAALAQYRVPLRPFLGVVAAATEGEGAPNSRESGAHGGNLEYARIREGATVYLPVNQTGAYFYLGDGHAAQGDGELTGDALETSMDVTFSIEIVRWAFASQTRVEDADALMSLGVGGSLDEAMRRATTDMARWLESRYRLSATEAALVMGTALAFDIPDVVNPGFGVVARMPKRALDQVIVAPRAP